MKFYRDNSEIRNQAPTRELDITHKGKIIVGKFVDKQAPTYLERMNAHLKTVLGERYVPWGEPDSVGENMEP
jgi:2-oxoglutarate ferredoxin oxidoreductase subunit beta